LDKFKCRPSGIRATSCCPFHNDKHPSFSINLKTGSFRCFTCAQEGSSVLDFHMRLYGMGFKDAAQDIGAWT
jgi:DNA primase